MAKKMNRRVAMVLAKKQRAKNNAKVAAKAAGAAIAKSETNGQYIAKVLRDDIALYLSPLTAVAGEFRKQLFRKG
jgi:hypothetical protein